MIFNEPYNYLLASFILQATHTKFPSILKAFTKDGKSGSGDAKDHCWLYSIAPLVSVMVLFCRLFNFTSVIFKLSTVSNRGQFGLQKIMHTHIHTGSTNVVKYI